VTSYSEVVNQFLAKVQEIKKLNPAYKQPGDGSDGTCDCIGLPIGAIRRMGLKWTGIHGTNWAARKEFVSLKKITSESELELGDVVLKAHTKGESGWRLPDRYQQGGKYYNGDLTDYYHAGVVTSVAPFQITHMSSKMTVDKKLGKWSYGGKLKILARAAGEDDSAAHKPQTPSDEDHGDVPTAGSMAVVVSQNGLPVKMRQYPSTSCRTWHKIPVGTKAVITNPGETWAKIDCCGRKGWYMMAKYLDIIGDGKGQY